MLIELYAMRRNVTVVTHSDLHCVVSFVLSQGWMTLLRNCPVLPPFSLLYPSNNGLCFSLWLVRRRRNRKRRKASGPWGDIDMRSRG